jgi:hypothetical protein
VRLAAVAYPDRGDVEALLRDFTRRLQARGVRVDGLLQESGREANGRPRMELIAIADGERFLISQNLGPDSRACCVDVGGVASAAARLRDIVDAAPALLVINKFSGLEAEGGGLAAEFLDAVARGIPVLIGLSARHQDAFVAATAGQARMLAADLAALEEWWVEITAAAPLGAGLPGC